jgi:hypothetical protein
MALSKGVLKETSASRTVAARERSVPGVAERYRTPIFPQGFQMRYAREVRGEWESIRSTGVSSGIREGIEVIWTSLNPLKVSPL